MTCTGCTILYCKSFFVDVMFSSAHRSKGLEFETVIVADDFKTGFVEGSIKEGILCRLGA